MRRSSIMWLCMLLAVPAGALPAAADTVVARVGDRAITAGELDRWVDLYGRGSAEGADFDDKRKAMMLDQIVTGMVVSERARKEGFDRRPEIQERLKLVVNNFLTLHYLDEVVAAKVKASAEDVKRYYERHPEEFLGPPSIRARHILVASERSAAAKDRAAARKKAEDLLARIRGGADFAALAAEFSDDPGSRSRGGDLGFFARGRMAPEFEKAALVLKAGEVSGVVETQFGYHLIRLEERRDATPRPLAEVRARIEAKLTREERRRVVDEFVKKAMADAKASIDTQALVGGDPHFGR